MRHVRGSYATHAAGASGNGPGGAAIETGRIGTLGRARS
jgi:hypothetical protein